MNRNIIITISIIIILIIAIIGFAIWKINSNNNSTTGYNENEITNSVNLSAELVTDDCINEWADYASVVENEIKDANANLEDEHTRYLIKNVDGYIYVYYLDDENNETLYKTTEISTEYLSVEDLDDLEIGIEVQGSKSLNELLENFE